MEWFRWYHGTVNDPKFTIISRLANQPKIAVLAVWSAILEYASQEENRGSIDGFDIEVTAVALDMDVETVVTICHAMSQRKLIDENRVLNWTKRQPKREDETAAERQRNKRDRDKLQAQLTELQKKLDDALKCHAMSRNVTLDRADRTEQIDREREKAAAVTTGEGSLEGGKGAAEENPVMTRSERVIRDTVAEKRADIARLFPHADITLQEELLVAKYRHKPVGADPWLLVLRWFQMVPKSEPRASPEGDGLGSVKGGNRGRNHGSAGTSAGVAERSKGGADAQASTGVGSFAGDFPDRSGDWGAEPADGEVPVSP